MICDRDFISNETREIHVQASENHPQCVLCNSRFLNGHSLREHQARFCPYSPDVPAPEGIHKRPLREHELCFYDEDDVGYDQSEDEDSDGESIAGDFHIGSMDDDDDITQAPKPIELPEALCIKDRIAQLQLQSKTVAQPLTPNKRKSQPSCGVCHEPTKVTVSTRCGHLFCQGCIQEKLEEKRVCPVCSSPNLKRQLRRIFLMS